MLSDALAVNAESLTSENVHLEELRREALRLVDRLEEAEKLEAGLATTIMATLTASSSGAPREVLRQRAIFQDELRMALRDDQFDGAADSLVKASGAYQIHLNTLLTDGEAK